MDGTVLIHAVAREAGVRSKVSVESTKANGFWLREQYVEIGEPKVLNIIGTLDVNFFNGEITYGMKILDMEAVEEPVKKKTLLQEILRKKSEDKNK